jgi:hypothetical protein
MTVAINDNLRNRQVDSVGGDLDSGFIDIYTGSQPGDPNTAPTGTLLVSCALTADAYAAAVAGSATVNGTVQGTAVAAGTAGYAQQRNAGNTRWMYGSVTATAGGGDVELTTTTIAIGQVVTISSSVITQPVS